MMSLTLAPPVDLDLIKEQAGVRYHGVNDVLGLEGEDFERGTDNMVAAGAARQAKEAAAGVHVPMGRAPGQ